MKKQEKWFDLQMFADEAGADPAEVETPENENNDEEPEERAKPKPQPKYTDDDVDRILNQRFARWQKEQEKKTSEAERLGKMTAEEKAAERMKALEERIHGYEVAAARAEMTKQARAILQDKNINVSDELLSNLVSEDADSTKASVESFVILFNDAVEKKVKEAYKGETPRKGSTATLTKEQILAVTNRSERQRLINENMHLFK